MENALSAGVAVFDFMEPLDWLKLLHVSKGTRKVAAAKLQEHEKKSPLLMGKRLMFEEWVSNAVVATDAFRWLGSDWSGPLRLDAIRGMADKLIQNFVVLDYHRSYKEERCTVVLFDDKGAVVAIYLVATNEVFEGYEHPNFATMTAKMSNTSECTMHMRSSADLERERLRDSNKAARNISRDPQCQWDLQQGYSGDVLVPNFALFRLFEGQLSPIEVACVLMHAVSSNNCVIYSFIAALYSNCFELEDFGLEYMFESYIVADEAQEWMGCLAAIEY